MASIANSCRPDSVWRRPPPAGARSESGPHCAGRGGRRQCARKRTSTERWKSSSVNSSLTVADRNCVVVTRGGEQRKANDRSERKKLDSAGTTGEPAGERRSLSSDGCRRETVLRREPSESRELKELARSCRGGWSQNGRKSECVNRGDLTPELTGVRSQSLRSSEEAS
jgi:hypothetical protein